MKLNYSPALFWELYRAGLCTNLILQIKKTLGIAFDLSHLKTAEGTLCFQRAAIWTGLGISVTFIVFAMTVGVQNGAWASLFISLFILGFCSLIDPDDRLKDMRKVEALAKKFFDTFCDGRIDTEAASNPVEFIKSGLSLKAGKIVDATPDKTHALQTEFSRLVNVAMELGLGDADQIYRDAYTPAKDAMRP